MLQVPGASSTSLQGSEAAARGWAMPGRWPAYTLRGVFLWETSKAPGKGFGHGTWSQMRDGGARDSGGCIVGP